MIAGKRHLFACMLLIASSSIVRTGAEETPNVSALGWLQGEWVGEGREGDDGPVEGKARLYWTPPLNGVVTYLFTWNKPEDGHVHHALTIFRDSDDGVIGKGIHYRRNFNTGEDRPWQLRLKNADESTAVFECFKDCRAQSLTFSIKTDGSLEERWAFDDENTPHWVVTYKRSERI